MKKLLMFVIIFMGLNSIAFTQTTFFVNVNSSNSIKDGSSWETAFTSLQSAIDEAIPSDQIWVAKGTYYPGKHEEVSGEGSVNPAYKDKAFVLGANNNDVKIYGGFNGNEVYLNERNWKVNKTHLSGYSGKGVDEYNYNHVLIAANAQDVIIDGFIISEGFANGSGTLNISGKNIDRTKGAAIYSTSSKLTIANSVFYYNNSTYGGAIYNEESNITFANSLLYFNFSDYGAAIFTQGASTTNLINTTIANNSASNSGGAIYHSGASNLKAYNSIIANNEANDGNDIYSESSSNYNFQYCLITNPNTSAGNIPVIPGNIFNQDPKFKKPIPELAPLADGSEDYGLQISSPAIDAGSRDLYPLIHGDLDLACNPRIINKGNIDMGAYEFVPQLAPNILGIIYVKKTATGNGNGQNWTNAVNELADALLLSKLNNKQTPGKVKQIWVATDTYYPIYEPSALTSSQTPASSRFRAFTLLKDLEIHGGFAGTTGTEGYISYQNPTTYPTILSGDLDKNDGDNFTNISNNAYHVIIASGDLGNALLDGFTIEGGNTYGIPSSIRVNGYYIGNDGAGIMVMNSSPKFNKLIIRNNQSIVGGGVSIISEYDFDSSPIFHNTEVSNNRVWPTDGGSSGGGITLRSGSNTKAYLTMVNCVVKNNKAKAEGGGIMNWDFGYLTLVNTLIYGNTSESSGGGITNNSSSSMILKNVTIANNECNSSSTNKGGGIYSIVSSDFNCAIQNSIIWGNKGNMGSTDNLTGINNSSLFNSMVEGVTIADGNKNIAGTTDPQFESAATSNYHLATSSPLLDKGNNSYISGYNVDLDGKQRIANSTVDLGAYEVQYCPIKPDNNGILYVNNDVLASGDGSSWDKAIKELADALLYTQSCGGGVSEIWVAKGMYYPLYKAAEVDDNNNPTTDRDLTFVLPENVKIYGGFWGSETQRDQRNWKDNITILSGDIGFSADNTDNCYHVVIATTTKNNVHMTLDGFTIQDGNADEENKIVVNGVPVEQFNGGGVYVAINDGNKGSIKAINFNPVFENLNIILNVAKNGGAIYTREKTNAIFNRVKVQENWAYLKGGGSYSSSSTTKFANCLFSNNATDELAGGMLFDGAHDTVTNVTIVGNMSLREGSGIAVIAGTHTEFHNTIMWGNNFTAPDGYSVHFSINSSYPKFSHSLIEGLPFDPSCIECLKCDNCLDGTDPTNDPNFDFDYKPDVSSTIINAGKNDLYNVGALGNTDIDGNIRIERSIIDMGAHEIPCNLIPIAAFLTADTVICSGATAKLRISITDDSGLNAIAPPYIITYTDDNGATYKTINDANSAYYELMVSPTTTTNYKLTKILEANGCETNLTVNNTVTVSIAASCISADNDTVIILACDQKLIDVLANDDIPVGATISKIVKNPSYGTAEIIGDKVLYTNTGGTLASCCESGGLTDTIVYEVCKSASCAEAKVLITILACPEITLTDSCSFHPKLIISYQYSGAKYDWQHSVDGSPASWNTIATGNINPDITINAEGFYRVIIYYDGKAHKSPKGAKVKINQTTKLPGGIWYNMEYEKVDIIW